MIVANWVGLWLWGLAIWFFLVSAGAHYSTVRHGRTKFAMTFYSYIFPNTALTSSTFAVGKALQNRPINILGCVMTCLLILAWMAILGMMVHAVVVKDILWPQKQEDREEGGWEKDPEEKTVCDPLDCDVVNDSEEVTINSATTASSLGRDMVQRTSDGPAVWSGRRSISWAASSAVAEGGLHGSQSGRRLEHTDGMV